MISHINKFVFIHIPKTGGTSIEHGLLNCGAIPDDFEFGTSVHYDLVSKQMAEDYFIFAFHRNPWDRFVSLWQYWMFKSKILNKYNLPKDFSFFCNNIDKIKSLVPTAEHVHFWPQISINGQQSHVRPIWFDFANLEENFKNICNRIGVQHKPLEKRNSTSHEHYTFYYDNNLANLIYNRYRSDVDYFKYKMN